MLFRHNNKAERFGAICSSLLPSMEFILIKYHRKNPVDGLPKESCVASVKQML